MPIKGVLGGPRPCVELQIRPGILIPVTNPSEICSCSLHSPPKTSLWRAWCSSYHSSRYKKSPLSDRSPVSKWINRLQVNFCTSKNVSWGKYVVVCGGTRKCRWVALICCCIVIFNCACVLIFKKYCTRFSFFLSGGFSLCMCCGFLFFFFKGRDKVPQSITNEMRFRPPCILPQLHCQPSQERCYYLCGCGKWSITINHSYYSSR